MHSSSRALATFFFKHLLVFVFFSFALVVNCSSSPFHREDFPKSSHKLVKKEVPLVKALKHKDTENYIKKLEYKATHKEMADNSLDFGLVPIDLNLLPDDFFADQIEKSVEEELINIDEEIEAVEETAPSQLYSTEEKAAPLKSSISIMHQGVYDPSPEFNPMVDGLIENVKNDIKQRDMDPLFFSVHNRGIIRHAPTNQNTKDGQNVSSSSNSSANGNKTNEALGGGVIEGLLKIKRFGNAESRRDGNVTLVRSHFFFGPLKVNLIFEDDKGLIIINSTLSSLAAHALFEVSNTDNSTTLKEFITDSPMDYEIRLRGSKHRRYRNLSQSAISRLFKRDGRMETRLERSFRRATMKSIREVEKQENKSAKKGDNRKKETMRKRAKP